VIRQVAWRVRRSDAAHPARSLMRSRRRSFTPGEVARLLEALGQSRAQLTAAMGKLPIRGPEYLAAEAVTDAIDGLAEVLTGSRQYFWTKAPKVQ
jgi:hypothetical protein